MWLSMRTLCREAALLGEIYNDLFPVHGGISVLAIRVALVAIMALLMLAAPGTAQAATPVIHGRASLLMDASTGQVLFEYNSLTRNFPASTTKLLTALVAAERGHLDQVIKISPNAVDQAPDSSSCYLNQGEEQPLEYLLYGLLLSSGNDCAIAIAEGITNGNPEQFIVWMNETAKRLGATRSRFTNPHGLHDSGHYTTAQDLAFIAKGALANPLVRKISGTREFNWPGKNNGTYYNHNAMLFTYDGTVGGKTGFTEEARLTLVTAAERDGRLLIGVLMGEDSRTNQYDDMSALLTYGFDNFENRVLVMQNSSQGTVAVVNGRAKTADLVAQSSFQVSVPKGAEPKTTVVRQLPDQMAAPVQVGQTAGLLEIREGALLLGTVPLLARSAVAAKPQVGKIVIGWVLVALKWIGFCGVGLFLFRTTVRTIRRVIRLSRKRWRPMPGRRTTSPSPRVVKGYPDRRA